MSRGRRDRALLVFLGAWVLFSVGALVFIVVDTAGR